MKAVERFQFCVLNLLVVEQGSVVLFGVDRGDDLVRE